MLFLLLIYCSVVNCIVLLLTVLLLLLILLLFVLFVCKCVLYYCHRVSTRLHLTNIPSHHIISYHKGISLKIPELNNSPTNNIKRYGMEVYLLSTQTQIMNFTKRFF